MKKIISILLMLAICLTISVYADVNEIVGANAAEEKADTFFNFENPQNTELLEQLELFADKNLDAKEVAEPPNDEEVVLDDSFSIIASGDCGESGNNLNWTVDSNGTLTISGNGNLAYYQSDSAVPWNEYANQIICINFDVTTNSLCSKRNSYAFKMLKQISEIKIPEGVEEIPQSANLFPTTLRKLILPSTYSGNLSCNSLIRDMCYLNVEVAEENPVYCSVNGTLFSKDRTKLIQYTRSAIEPNYVIPETVTDIDDAFYGNAFLQTLTITKNVKIVDRDTYNNTFWNLGIGISACYSQCRAVYVDAENPYFCSVDDVLYNKDMTILIWCPPRKTGDQFIIPDTVKIIAAGAFNHSRYSSVQIPNGVEVLGNSAWSAANITSITIPKSVNEIYNSCFFLCSNLSKVYIEAEETVQCVNQIFDHCPNLKTAGTMGSGYDIEFCWSTAIPSYIFSNCGSLTEVTIPSSVTSIGSSAFADCSGLTELILPENVTEIGHKAFYKCTGLTEITIPHSVTAIDNYAFDGCTALSDMYIDKIEGTLAGTLWRAPNARITYLREVNIEPIPNSYMYTGYAIMPTVRITEDRKDGTVSIALMEATDYTLIYADNINAGTANITIDYINSYANVANGKLIFEIIPRNSNKLNIAPIPDQMCTGKAITPNPCITDMDR